MIFTKPRGKKDVPSLAFIVKNMLVTLVTYRHLDGSHIQTTMQAVSYSEAWTPAKIAEDLVKEGWGENGTIPEIIAFIRIHLEGLTQLDLRFAQTAVETLLVANSKQELIEALDTVEYISQEFHPEYLLYIKIAKDVIEQIHAKS